MAHVDTKSSELVIRIVYDGAPEAGKTTNVEFLTSQVGMRRRGAVGSPGTNGSRTEFFDWLDFSGGYVDGRRVRCQLVSVPGQPELLRRRRYLLQTADAVVYVADSRPEHVAENRSNLERSCKILEQLGRHSEIGLVVQANKQDLPGALPPKALSEALGLPEHVAVVPSVACAGEGVMQTFVLAARLATDRVRALPQGHGKAEPSHATPTALYEAMRVLDGVSMPPSLARKNACPSDFRVPDAIEAGAEDVWPPVKGRGLLTRAEARTFHASELLTDWAPTAAWELRDKKGSFLHTAEQWSFADAAAARRHLLSLVRAQQAWAELAHKGRALFITAETSGWFRVWAFTASVTPLVRWVDKRLAERDATSLALLRRLLARVQSRVDELGRVGRVSLSSLGVTASGLAVLDLETNQEPAGPTVQLLDELLDHARVKVQDDPDLSSWLAAQSPFGA